MNHITLSGHVATEPKIGEGSRPHSFRLAFDEKRGDEYVPAFIEVKAFLDGDDFADSITKGAAVVVAGQLSFFKTKDDQTVFTILAREVGPAVRYASKGDSGGSRPSGRSNGTSRPSGRSGSTTRSRSADLDEAY